MGSGEIAMTHLQINQVVTIAIVIGSIGSVSSLIACLFYPLVQKIRSKQTPLRQVSLTIDGETIDAQIPTDEAKKLLSKIKKYHTDDIMWSAGSRC